MESAEDLSATATLLADRTRARMLMLLMDGRAWTATELALAGTVSPSTASSHLAKLARGGILAVRRQGRHRYYRLSSGPHAAAIEALVGLSSAPVERLAGPSDAQLREARVCYDHLAGSAGVRMMAQMFQRGCLSGDEDTPILTEAGAEWCGVVGIDLARLRSRARPVCRSCLDWSERRFHLAGALGAAILNRLVELRYARRIQRSRAIILSPRGEAFINRLQLPR